MIDAFSPALWPAAEVVAPGMLFFVALSACFCTCVFLWCVGFIHRRHLARIPVRIHVAGTRGKSATVRLVAAGLRAGGYRVLAKTTGAQPRILLPDGREQPLRRWGVAAIREQRSFVATAHRLGAQAVVVEAMAIEPEYLHALECFYIRATDLVITNVRPDHQEQLGCDPAAMAEAVAETIPAGGRLFLSLEAGVPIIMARAALQRCEVAMATCDPDTDPQDINRRLALEVCRWHGVPAADAESAMRLALPDIGAFALIALRVNDRSFGFANAFSCNDAQSFELLWRRYQPTGRPAAFVLNVRADRPIRTREFLKLLLRLAPNSPLFVTGDTNSLRRQATAAGFAPQRLHRLPRRLDENALRALAAGLEDGTVLWGVGNFRGAGARLVALAEAARSPC